MLAQSRWWRALGTGEADDVESKTRDEMTKQSFESPQKHNDGTFGKESNGTVQFRVVACQVRRPKVEK